MCVKSNNQIYLAVSGCEPVYSKDKTDLFDLTNLLPNNLVIFQILNLEYLINDEETVLPQPSTVKSQAEKIKKLIQERDWYKAKFIEIRSKYNDLKERLDLLYKKKNKKSAVSYQTKIMQLQIKYYQNNDMTTFVSMKPFIENLKFGEIDHFIITHESKQEIQEEKQLSKKQQNQCYEIMHQNTKAEDQAQNLTMTLDSPQRTRIQMEGIIMQR